MDVKGITETELKIALQLIICETRKEASGKFSGFHAGSTNGILGNKKSFEKEAI